MVLCFCGSASFSGKFAPNFDLKNTISTYMKDENFMRKIAQICQILKLFQIVRRL
jgi:hypothetical protein